MRGAQQVSASLLAGTPSLRPLPAKAVGAGVGRPRLSLAAGVGRQRRRASGVLPPRAQIGFDLPGSTPNNKSAEKTGEELTRAASSLLLYQSVLRGKPAQAFLQVLLHLQKGSPLKLLEHYGELYRLLAADGHSSWQEYVLHQITMGYDNPFAKVAAAGDDFSHLQAAAAHDLDVLQQLAVTESTLATWVKETAYAVADEWLAAARSLAAPKANGSAPAQENTLQLPGTAAGQLLAPLSEQQRAALRADIAGRWRWGAAAEDLGRYHACYGQGLVSAHSVLTWGGKLQAQDVLKGAHGLEAAEQEGLVGHAHPAAGTLLEALSDFLRGAGSSDGTAMTPPHVAVVGNSLDRWLFTTWALQRLPQYAPPELQAAASGLRTVLLPSSQLSTLPELAWSLSQHPQARFAVLANGLEACSAATRADLVGALSGFDGFSWPPNALLIAGLPGGDAAYRELEEAHGMPFSRVATIQDRFA